MLTPIWCATGALVLLWWPPPRERHRVVDLSGEELARRRPRWTPVAAVVVLGGGLLLDPSVAVSAAIVAVLGIWLQRRSSRRERLHRETTDLLSALSAITAELSIGTPPPAAFALAGAELAERDSTVSETMRTMASRAALGGAPRAESSAVGGPIDPQWRRITLAWEIAHESGVPIKDLLESVRSDLAARRGFAARTDAGLAGPRATAAVLALLPILGIGLGQALGAHPIAILAGGGMGGVLLVVGTALGAGGLWWSLRIADHVVAQ
ncbi:type II secretion system protein F [Gordonia sp. TBRC 11910]|uniref:Type II secretion system protein F n=1 Tax=Gordonia asplenii TaxID=2725283 RepID=A0A848KYH8_9ACTN|nr:type II secretion system F family protein [Gordonia asplenii]NMO03187.1 type II secretion system protein F [Gordonia asplenii]